MEKKCCTVSKVACLLVIIGAINWGLVGAFGFDLVAYIAAMVGSALVAKVIYILVGVSGVLLLVKKCSQSSCSK